MNIPPRTAPGRCSLAPAFSLVELLVVVSIIGVLVALAVPAYSSFTDRLTVTKVQAEQMRGLVAAMALYRAEHNNQWPMPKKTGAFTNEFHSWYGPPTKESDSKLVMLTLRPYYGRNVIKEDGTFKDPWGSQYSMKWDIDNSGSVEYYGKANRENVRSEFIVVSLGKNKKQDDPNTKSADDVFNFCSFRDAAPFQ
jgi:prepilin-type N-terminal cleavage/methylation domain-containing protein